MNKYIVLFLSIIFLNSCEDFLESRDKSQILETKLFVNQEGIEEAMYGIYYDMGIDQLYGAYFSFLPDLMSHCYYTVDRVAGTTSTISSMDELIMHNYGTDQARQLLTEIWTNTYKVISRTNKVIENLENWAGLPLKHGDMYYGECLGIRALLHFEALRRYGSPNSSNRGIPYVDRYGMYVTPFYTTGECYKKIIADLRKAETLLSEDEEFMIFPRPEQNKYDPYTTNREFHVNLYAVKALLARVYWTRNQGSDMDSAAYYARQVIESRKFPLPTEGIEITPPAFRVKMAGTVDVNEAILGIYKSDTYTMWSDLFTSTVSAYLPAFPDLYYYSGTSGKDVRSEWIKIPEVVGQAAQEKLGERWCKLINPSELDSDNPQSGVGSNGVNLIRTPEMYFILAEALLNTNPTEALEVYNEFIVSRGLPESEGPLTLEMIDEEVKKEFAQEGVYWFRLRRNQVAEIAVEPKLAARYRENILQMSEEKWIYYIPEGEFEFRMEGTY